MKRNTIHRALGVCCLLLSVQVLTACSLLPQEDGTQTAPVVITEEQDDYELEVVRREDIVSSQTVYCTYSQMDDEELHFGKSGTVAAIYVKVGDTVTAGDLLAEYNLGSDVETLTNLTDEIERQKLSLAQQQEMLTLYQKKLLTSYSNGFITEQAYQTGLLELDVTYGQPIRALQDDLHINELRHEALSERIAASQIYAGMDGTVSYIKPELLNSRQNSDDHIMTVIDSSVCAFRAESKYASYFPDGEPITVTLSGGATYETVIRQSEEEDVVYFELLEPDFEIAVGVRGTVYLVLESKSDVLTLPTSVIRKTKTFSYVYYLNDEGVRCMQEVETGITGNNRIEIVSGLSYGDLVIKK